MPLGLHFLILPYVPGGDSTEKTGRKEKGHFLLLNISAEPQCGSTVCDRDTISWVSREVSFVSLQPLKNPPNHP